ncbi:MAG: type II secretion system F family protein [Sedimentisphaerales bacterium]|nr:type II secretion system F family protein [Sedimentisphaerales bacterium]
MPLFKYIELSSTGQKKRGTIDAASISEARRRLRTAKVHLLDITDERKDVHRQIGSGSRTIGFRQIKQRDISISIRQLSTLLHAGIPLVPALSALVEQLSTHPLAKVFSMIREKVNEGMPLAKAMDEYPAIFSEVFVSMIRAGETAGTLENVLLRLAEIMERRTNLTNKVKSAMAYPLFMAIVGLSVVVFIFSYVIPSITKLFLEMNRQLPWPTVMLIRVSDFIGGYFWILLIVLLVIVVAPIFLLRTTKGRRGWDRIKLKLPLFGNLNRKIAISRLSRTLAVLLASGISIVETLELSKRVTGNTVFSDVIDEAKDAISHGAGIAESFRRGGIFPPIVIHMISAGEKSGGIEEGLTNVADAFDNDVEVTVKALTSLLEPVMIVLLGIIVGFIVLAILLPIFDINRAIV